MRILSFPEADAPEPSATLTHDPALHPRSMLLVEDGQVLAALNIRLW
jgi:hypothetical protein